jgi:very-short-patch-repair endonuclease
MTSEQRDFARKLRRLSTPAEEALWRELRARRLGGAKMRRQVPLGPYVADFACLAARLVIEIDGAAHRGREEYDARRTAEIEAMGFAVLRFTSVEVEENLSRVLDRIRAALGCSDPA